jgi:general stress protein CsbA
MYYVDVLWTVLVCSSEKCVVWAVLICRCVVDSADVVFIIQCIVLLMASAVLSYVDTEYCCFADSVLSVRQLNTGCVDDITNE